MDTLTAIRTFAKPGFSPAKRVKIFNDRWYQVTMQNIERGQGDYLGLGEGQYTELLPGNKARERRDAQLNHCNSIAEYSGPVFELLANRYGHELQHVGFYSDTVAMQTALDARKAEHDKWIQDCREEGLRHARQAEELERGVGKSIMTPADHRRTATECADVANKYAEAFRCDARKVR